MSDEPAGDTILAAGGVVWRAAGDGGRGDGAVGDGGAGPEILVVHRPRYDDWTLPKGKVEPGDADLVATARREVWEETGLRCRVGADLGEVGYEVRGRPKVVHYWSMRLESGAFTPNNEVDVAEWMTPDAARERLGYQRDVQVVDRFLAAWV